MQEVQGAIVLARKFPRDLNAIDLKIDQACKRQKLAEKAMYAYPRRGSVVTGPSIRLAEAIAQIYGNLDFGIRELEQRDGESVVEAYCWDSESNVRQTKTFTVKHNRKARGKITRLTDPRDIYELVANNGARRLRACILGVVPGDIIDSAVEACEKTLAGANKAPIADRVKSMLKLFSDIGVSQKMIEKRLGHKIEATIETEILSLAKIYNSIKDEMSSRWDWFENPEKKGESSSGDLNQKLKNYAENLTKKPE